MPLSLSLSLAITILRFAFLEIIDNYAAVSRRKKKRKERKSKYIYIYTVFFTEKNFADWLRSIVRRVVSFLHTSVASVELVFISNFILNRVVVVARFQSIEIRVSLHLSRDNYLQNFVPIEK